MGETTKQVKFEISAVATGFIKTVEGVTGSLSGMSEQVNSEFGRVGKIFEELRGKLLMLASVFAGGGALKAFISEANSWNGEAAKMSKQLGITSEQASVLKVALHGLGIDTEVYTSAADKLSKQVTNNAQAFDVMGVKLKDSQGNYRDIDKIMADVNEKIGAISNTIERDEAGRQAYGKSWTEIRAILKLNNEVMEEAKETAKRLHLVVGPEGATQSKLYSKQMRELGLVGESLEIQFGNALLPVFVKTGAWLSAEGPRAGEVFGKVLETILYAAEALWVGLTDLGDSIAALGAQAAAVLRGDFEAVKLIGQMRDEEAAKSEKKLADLYANLYKSPPPVKVDVEERGADKGKNGPHYHFGNDESGREKKQLSSMSNWEAQLAEAKLSYQEQQNAAGSFRQFDKAQEAQFWRDRLALTVAGSNDNLAVRRKLAELQLAINKDAFEAEVGKLKAQEAAYKNNTDAKLAILDREAELMKQRFGVESKEYADVQKAIVETKRQAAEQIRQIAEVQANAERQARLSQLAIEEQAAQLEGDMGLRSRDELLLQQQQFEARRYQIARDALDQRLALAEADKDRNPVAVAQINAEIEGLEEQHQQRMTQLRGELSKESPLVTTWNNTRQAIGNAVGDILTKQKTLQQGMAAVWTSIRQSVSQAISKMVQDMVMGYIRQRVMAMAGIGTDAAKAGAGAAASQASIPYVGPALAVAAMASIFGAVSGMASKVPTASAAGGYDIPAAVNPVVQAHAREMILPAALADKVRNMTDQPISDAAPVFHIHTDHPDTWGKWLRNGGDVAILDTVNKAYRNGWRPR